MLSVPMSTVQVIQTLLVVWNLLTMLHSLLVIKKHWHCQYFKTILRNLVSLCHTCTCWLPISETTGGTSIIIPPGKE